MHASRTSPQAGYAALKKRIVDEGLLESHPLNYVRDVWIILGLLALGVGLIAICPSTPIKMIGAVVFAVAIVQVGLMGHDAAHGQVFSRTSRNQLMAIACMNLGLGGSAGWWRDKHNRHHAAPNTEDADPDIDMAILAFTPEQAASRKYVAKAIVRHQAKLFFPLSTLVYAVMQWRSIAYLCTNTGKWKKLEAVSTAAHYLLITVPFFLFLDIAQFVAYLLVVQATAGIYMACVFAPNHKGMPVLKENHSLDFLSKQVITSRNVKQNAFVDFMFGGLACQVEHHLFPSMSRYRLREASHIVRDECAKQGIAYHEAPALMCYREMLQYLNFISGFTTNRSKWG